LRDRYRLGPIAGAILLGVLAGVARPALATVAMQKQARELGYKIENCHYCHASPKAVAVMKKRVKDLGYKDLNCIQCHGENLPPTLNARGDWLVAEQKKRGAKTADMAWLKDFVEPTEPAKKP
jgi:hypothetical protein